MRKSRIALYLCAVAFCLIPLGSAQTCVSITGGAGLAYTQDFNTLATTGTTNTLTIPGWYLYEAGTNANQLYAAGTGSGTAGDVYSFGATGSTERALGTLLSGNLTPTIGACFTNNTGQPITSVQIRYAGEQYRVGTAGRGADTLKFELSLDATSLSTGTWAANTSLDYVGASDLPVGSGTPLRTTQVGPVTISSLNIAPGGTFWIRWTDFNASGADDGLAVDDFTLTATAGAASMPPSIAGTANPGAIDAGASTLLSGTITPGAGPASVGYTVTCDLTTIGGAAAESAAVAGTDWALSATVPLATIPGVKTINCAVKDDQARTGSVAIGLTVRFTAAACGLPATPISAIQGSGMTSPKIGSTVAVEGIVVGDFQSTSTGLSGFYLEQPADTQDSDPSTSEGIFVYDNGLGVDVSVGDRVRVAGVVAEYKSGSPVPSSLTELTGVSKIVCGTGNAAAPVDITLPLNSATDWERYEGMLVRIVTPVVVTGNYNLGAYGQIDLAPSVLFQPTAVTLGSGNWAAVQDSNDRSIIALDDGSTLANANLYPTLFPAGGLSATNTLRAGARVNYDPATSIYTPITGVVDDRVGAYRIQPTQPVTFDTTPNPRPSAATLSQAALGGRFKIFGGNVLNFFTTLNKRGAANATEYNNQLAKIVAELVGADADLYGISEVQNYANGNSGSAGDVQSNVALDALVAAMNAATAPNTFAYVDTVSGVPSATLGQVNGTDAIRNAIIYKPSRLAPVGSFATYYQNDQNRPSLAQTFKPASGVKPDLQTFTFAVNHFRSKGSACGATSDDPYQGNCNGMRLSMATNVANWLATNPTSDVAGANRRIVMVGDFNAYLYEDPIVYFTSSGYTDLVNAILGAGAYSYTFSSQIGYIDHALANAAANRLVKKVAEWHINADEPPALEAYKSSTKSAAAKAAYYAPNEFAASDHDPVVIGFNPLCGDLNDDGLVNAADHAILSAAIGQPKATVDRRADFDGDGAITPKDYSAWAACAATFQSNGRSHDDDDRSGRSGNRDDYTGPGRDR